MFKLNQLKLRGGGKSVSRGIFKANNIKKLTEDVLKQWAAVVFLALVMSDPIGKIKSPWGFHIPLTSVSSFEYKH